LTAGVATDSGHQRTNNEDLYYVDPKEGVFVVVDGVGGEAAGEEASKTAVAAIEARFRDPGGDTEERIREAIANANNRIYQSAQEHPERRGMACVLTLAVVEGRTVTVGHVGDSRLYRIRNGRMEKITPDHSPIGEREDRGELTEAEAMAHPRRNEVYRDVGSEPHQPDDPGFIDILHTSLPRDAAILLASDGLTDMLTREQILRVVQTYDRDPHRIARALVDAANEAGGKDNITVVFVPGPDFSPQNGHATTRPMRPAGKAKANRKRSVPEQPAPPAPVVRGSVLENAAPVEVKHEERPAVAPLRIPFDRAEPAVSHRFARWSTLVGVVLLLAGLALWSFQSPWIKEYLHLDHTKMRVGRGQRYTTIAAALDAAHEGDTVVVNPGVYPENVVLKSGVSLISSQARKAEIQARGTAVNAQNITDARISGFRIVPDGTNTLQIGLRARDSTLQIDNSEFSGASDAGVVIEGDSTARLAHNFIHNNARTGVRTDSSTPPDMQGNRICDNGQDIVPASSLAEASNVTGACNAREPAHQLPRPSRGAHNE
jgi:serine/threonine protein phosphatase PrpC